MQNLDLRLLGFLQNLLRFPIGPKYCVDAAEQDLFLTELVNVIDQLHELWKLASLTGNRLAGLRRCLGPEVQVLHGSPGAGQAANCLAPVP